MECLQINPLGWDGVCIHSFTYHISQHFSCSSGVKSDTCSHLHFMQSKGESGKRSSRLKDNENRVTKVKALKAVRIASVDG